MTVKLSKELADALDSSGREKLKVVHPTTNRLYVVVDDQVHRKAMEALRRQEDHDAIAEGKPLHEVEAEMRAEFGYPPRA